MGFTEKAPGFGQVGCLLQRIFQLDDGCANLTGGVVIARAGEMLFRRRRVASCECCAS